MKSTIIVTDLTRFREGNPNLCTAGIDTTSGLCIRPLPYLTEKLCEKLQILPGAKLKGTFTHASYANTPHIEDHDYDPGELEFEGPCTSEEFLAILDGSKSPSIAAGFGVQLKSGEKVITKGAKASCSLVTIEIDPNDLSIVEDKFKAGKIKAHLRDGSGVSYSFLPITDLGFHKHAQAHHSAEDLASLNEFVRAQERLFIRVGLSRIHESPDGRCGYWIQLNGIYTFPDFKEDIRSYRTK